MSKGFNNFMSKKTFHPGSYQNQRRIHEAEAAAEAKRKHDQETLAQYLKEQELFQQQSLVSKESKDKLSLSFMYSAPPGTSNKKDSDDKDTDEPKWDREVKREKLDTTAKRIDDSDDDEPRILLKWKRTEPKSKNHKPITDEKPKREDVKGEKQPSIKTEEPKIKKIKKER